MVLDMKGIHECYDSHIRCYDVVFVSMEYRLSGLISGQGFRPFS